MTAQITDTIKVAISKLAIDPLNARKRVNATKLAELAESIAHEGVIQNIVVRPAEKKGHFYITAGGRRFRAVTALIEQGRLPKTFEFECKVKSTDSAGAVALSIAENIMRDDMDPLDQYQAFSHLADQGLPTTDIAARFGITEIIVNRRLKLSRVHPDLHEEYRTGKISFEQLSAFTVTDDQDAQIQVWKDLPYYGRSASSIKSALTPDSVPATDKRVLFIGGLDIYEQAGGAVIRDLFSDGSGFATDIALLEKMVADKLAGEVANIEAEGWAWVEVLAEWSHPSVVEFDRSYPAPVEKTEDEKAEYDALNDELINLEQLIESETADEEAEQKVEAISSRLAALDKEAYPTDVIATSGVFIALTHRGEVRIERGFRKRDETPKEVAAADKGDETPKLSASFIEDLTAQKTAAIRSELVLNHDVALAAVVHAILLPICYSYAQEHSCLEISTSRHSVHGSMKQPDQSKAVDALENLAEDIKGRIPSNPADFWDWCIDLKRSELLELLAFGASQTVNAVEGKSTYRNAKHLNHSNQLVAALGTDMHSYFEPTAANCFSNMNRGMIQAAVAEARGDEFAKGISDMKKSDAAAYAEKAIKGTGWLPSPLIISKPTIKAEAEAAGSEPEHDEAEQPNVSNDTSAEIIQFPEAAA